jgi:hypothetical protein
MFIYFSVFCSLVCIRLSLLGTKFRMTIVWKNIRQNRDLVTSNNGTKWCEVVSFNLALHRTSRDITTTLRLSRRLYTMEYYFINRFNNFISKSRAFFLEERAGTAFLNLFEGTTFQKSKNKLINKSSVSKFKEFSKLAQYLRPSH